MRNAQARLHRYRTTCLAVAADNEPNCLVILPLRVTPADWSEIEPAQSDDLEGSDPHLPMAVRVRFRGAEVPELVQCQTASVKRENSLHR